ncbi:bacterial transcriptional activator domain-containing protein [Deinococcus marmoris]|uniref:bacterial transcriptional activator domain-containing protein n=1 Tax=Deinococcus marmoris TaxID=249408 RepID=UPI00096A30C1|nr:bacterial transcriptional activator domain-containing protein [Deinococcus marmoris]
MLLWLHWYGSGTLVEILDALWDGSRDPKHHSYFRVVVRRLRTTLREALTLDLDPLPHVAGRYQIHPELVVSSDLQDFLERARKGEPEELLGVRADDLLSSIEGEWVEEIRKTIRSEQHLVLGELEGTLASQDPERAIALLKHSVRLQGDQAAPHLSLIQTLLRFRPQEAAAAYRGYAQMLDSVYGEEPDPVLRRTIESLEFSR